MPLLSGKVKKLNKIKKAQNIEAERRLDTMMFLSATTERKKEVMLNKLKITKHMAGKREMIFETTARKSCKDQSNQQSTRPVR